MVNEEDAPFFDVKSVACHACAARDRTALDAVKSNGGEAPPGRYYLVTSRERKGVV